MGMGSIIITQQLCKGCGYCVTYCPKQILEIGAEINDVGYRFVVQTDADLCTGCGVCALMCPDAAINVYRA